jgi:3-hydroxyacyl-[acyl-carrier-protein] dehydratase
MLRDEIIASTDKNIKSLEGGRSYEMTFNFDKSFTGFKGHFPQYPVLPAFVQLMTGECAVRLRTARDWRLSRIQKAKFLKTILPGQTVNVRWDEQPADKYLRCSFTILVGEEKAAVFTIELTPEENADA